MNLTEGKKIPFISLVYKYESCLWPSQAKVFSVAGWYTLRIMVHSHFFALILVREKWLKHFFIIIFFFITKGLLLFLIYFSRRFFTRKWNKHSIDNKWNNPHRSNLQNCNLLIRRWHIAPTLKSLGFYFSFLFFLLPFFDGSTFPFLFAQSNQRGLFAFWLKCRWTCQIQFSFTPHQFICQTKDCMFF